jgi:hypothetical protein
MKVRRLLMLLQEMVASYDQILDCIPTVNALVVDAQMQPICSKAAIDALTAERARLLVMIGKLTTRLNQEITIPTL